MEKVKVHAGVVATLVTRSIFLSIIFISSLCQAIAGNELPLVSNLSCSVNANHKRITVQYDLSDADDKTFEVFLMVVDPRGVQHVLSKQNLKGDVGYPVKAGKKRKIFWQCSDSISFSDLRKCRLKVVADDHYEYSINEIVKKVDTSYMRNALTKIYGVRHYEISEGAQNIQKTKDFIHNEFRRFGLETKRQAFSYATYTPENIIGTVKGRSFDNEIVILGAHFDTVANSPGADDNGSGIIGMLAAMQILSKFTYERTISFVGFDLEEAGHLGSQNFVKTLKEKPSQKILGCINFDMIGYYSTAPNSQKFPKGFDKVFPQVHKVVLLDSMRGNFAVIVANENSSELNQRFENAIEKYVKELKSVSLLLKGTGESFPDLRRSDHASFWDSGLPALYIGDGAYSRNPHYHKPGDTIDSINMVHISNVVKATVSMIAELAIVRHSSSAESALK
jgi:hypothetical protein